MGSEQLNNDVYVTALSRFSPGSTCCKLQPSLMGIQMPSRGSSVPKYLPASFSVNPCGKWEIGWLYPRQIPDCLCKGPVLHGGTWHPSSHTLAQSGNKTCIESMFL